MKDLADNDLLYFVRKFPNECCAEVSRKGELQPCGKTAFAVADGVMMVSPAGGRSACITPVLGEWCHSLTYWPQPYQIRYGLNAANNRQPLRLNTDTRIRLTRRALTHRIAHNVGHVAARDRFGIMPAAIADS